MTETVAAGSIRRMLPEDVPAALELSRQANWNQTAADWRRLLHWEPAGCWVLERDGRIVGTVTTTGYGEALAWIGMLLVDAAERRQGFGRRLLLHALFSLAERGTGAVMLDATPLGQPLYEGLGFRAVSSIDRWQAPAAAVQTTTPPLGRSVDPDGPFAVGRELDRRAFGLDRGRILDSLRTAAGAACFQAGQTGDSAGFVLLRPGLQRWHIGPLVARNSAVADGLLQQALTALRGRPVEVDVPRHADAQEIVRRAGLTSVRPFVRMVRGEPAPPGDPALVYATAGPEIG